MTKRQFKNEKAFQVMMYLIRQISAEEILTMDEVQFCHHMMLQKYHPPIGTIMN